MPRDRSELDSEEEEEVVDLLRLRSALLLEEARLTWADLDRAEGVALLNALRGLSPVGHLEGLGPLDPAHPLLIRAAEVLEAALG